MTFIRRASVFSILSSLCAAALAAPSIPGPVLSPSPAAATASAAAPSGPAATPPMAQSPSLAASSVAAELAQVQAQIPLLEAQAKAAKLKQEIANPAGAAGSAPGHLPMAGASPMGPPSYGVGQPGVQNAYSVPVRASRPRVLAITGYDGSLSAMMDVAGRRVPATVGSTLGKGYRVIAITSAHVVIKKGRETLTLRP